MPGATVPLYPLLPIPVFPSRPRPIRVTGVVWEDGFGGGESTERPFLRCETSSLRRGPIGTNDVISRSQPQIEPKSVARTMNLIAANIDFILSFLNRSMCSETCCRWVQACSGSTLGLRDEMWGGTV